MSKIVEFDRDVPCFKRKPVPKNLLQLVLTKNWIGNYVVSALDAGRAPVLEKSFSEKSQLEVWCSNQFEDRLFPSDIAAMIEVANNGDTADFPFLARLDALERYGMKKPLSDVKGS